MSPKKTTAVTQFYNKTTAPIYIPEKQDGYDKTSRRYRRKDGVVVSKRNFVPGMSGKRAEETFGFHFNLGATPVSDAMKKYDNIVMAAETFEKLVTDEEYYAPQPLPPAIRAQMSLARYYTKTEGDVRQHIEAPIDISIGKLEIHCPDSAAEKTLKEAYALIDMEQVLEDIWYSTAIFGIGLPMECWDKEENRGYPYKVVLLPPKNVWIGYTTRGSDAGGSPYEINPFGNQQEWTMELVRDSFMPKLYNAFAPQWNEQVNLGRGIPIRPDAMFPVRAKALSYERYPDPPLSGAFRSISTRTVFDEMVRAIIEGHQNQLWLFLLGNKEHPPSPAEMKALRSMLDGMSGSRTGKLAWNYWLDVKQFAPKPLDDMLGIEARQEYSLRIFRDLGGSIRLETGNQAGNAGGKGDSGSEVDLSVWLKRLEYLRRKVLRWEEGYRMRLADHIGGGSFTKAMEKTTVQFSKSLLEKHDLIANELQPLYTIGALSAHTYLERAGYNYAAEIEKKKGEAQDKELLSPVTAFVQESRTDKGERVDRQNELNREAKGGGDGEDGGKKTVGQSQPAGRPHDSQNAKKKALEGSLLSENALHATWEDDERRKALFAAVAALWDKFLGDRDAEAFVSDLRKALTVHLHEITLASYAAYGGGLPNFNADVSADFVNSFADGLLERLKDALANGGSLDKLAQDVLLYPQEGYKMAFVNGQREAMSERGAGFWQRVLHPEASLSGPCANCRADAQIVHPIAEPFQVLHPNEKCSAQALYIRYYSGGIPSLEMPVPTSDTDVVRRKLAS